LRLTPDRTTIQANGEDLSFVTVEAVDAEGRPDLHADQDVQFSIAGPGVIAAVGNGDGQDPASYHTQSRKLYQGRALLVVRTARQAGVIKVSASASGLGDGSVSVEAKPAQARAELQ
jgi:beta-galactosidase